MNSKLLGGILLVVGCTIGAGILALPVATAELGFWGSLVLLVSAWVIMTICAFLVLEVNLWLPAGTNLISMAGATLGKAGQTITWVTYLILLYSFICAYIAGGGDLVHYLLNTAGIHLSRGFSSVLFTGVFGLIVYLGIRSVDYMNRGLMFGKMGAYVLLVIFMVPFVSAEKLSGGQLSQIASPSGMTVVAAAFGSLMIIPSLRTYFGGDVRSLRKAIFIGMLIPLVCYIAWDLVILGIIPLHGKPGLSEMMNSSSTNSDVLMALNTLLQKSTIDSLAKFFTSICMTTSFLSISLCLTDFLSDGLKMSKRGLHSIVIYGITFIPPVLIVLFYPSGFLRALEYAGVCCFILMVLLPPLMVWRGRYHYALALDGNMVMGGKFLLAVLMIFATLMIGFGIEGAI
jgi:tyrosine-specific transport protein